MLEYEQIGGEKVDNVRTEISYNVFYSSNMKPLGQIYKEIDGLYVYQPSKISGCWSGDVLVELGLYLKELNTEWLNKMSKFKKKPVVIDAWELEYNTHCIDALIGIIGDKAVRGPDGSLFIATPEGTMTAVTGDYIIKDVQGEFYPCKPDIFHQTCGTC